MGLKLFLGFFGLGGTELRIFKRVLGFSGSGFIP